jgi:hypothetical protein
MAVLDVLVILFWTCPGWMQRHTNFVDKIKRFIAYLWPANDSGPLGE